MEALEPFEAELLVVTPGAGIDDALARMDGLLLTAAADVHPSRYGERPDPNAGLLLNEARDAVDFALLDAALARDLPVVGICRGMQVLNVACGGSLLQHVPGHRPRARERHTSRCSTASGSRRGVSWPRLSARAGMWRVNSVHHQGLTEARRAPTLMSTAYSVEDGLVEGAREPASPLRGQRAVPPERADELPRQFQNLFGALVHQAATRGG